MTTRVRVKTTYAGPLGTARAGSVIELPDDQAEGLIAAGYAEAAPVPDAAADIDTADGGGDETATNDARETATPRRPRARAGTSRTNKPRPQPKRASAASGAATSPAEKPAEHGGDGNGGQEPEE